MQSAHRAARAPPPTTQPAGSVVAYKVQPGHAGLAREEVRFALGALHGERLDPQKRLEQRVEVLQIPVRIPCARARAVGPRAPPAEAAATGLSAKRFDTAWDGDSPSTCGWSVARCTEAGLKLVLQCVRSGLVEHKVRRGGRAPRERAERALVDRRRVDRHLPAGVSAPHDPAARRRPRVSARGGARPGVEARPGVRLVQT